MHPSSLLQKYASILEEEINVKEITEVDPQLTFSAVYVPLGNKLSEQFGKDTWQIIAAAKQGNATRQADGTLCVKQGEKTWILPPDTFETRYEGIDENIFWIWQWAVVSLDTTLTPELKREGIARELSRACNQLRKEANYRIDERVAAYMHTDDTELQATITAYTDFLCSEALLSSLTLGSGTGEITQTIEIDGLSTSITLKRNA
jgi:isoleucyl-tRNA synthetase